jgi:hypothetical protein
MTGGAAAPVNQGAAPLILVDAHVHLHPCFPPAAVLDAAAANIAAAGAALGLETPPPGMLMLAEIAGMDAFGALAAGRLDCGAWRIVPVATGRKANTSGASRRLVKKAANTMSATPTERDTCLPRGERRKPEMAKRAPPAITTVMAPSWSNASRGDN